MCDPRTYYECLRPRLTEYARNNEATKCNCPRQCRRLSYDYTISQAQFSDFLIRFVKDVFLVNESEDAIRYDHCLLGVAAGSNSNIHKPRNCTAAYRGVYPSQTKKLYSCI